MENPTHSFRETNFVIQLIYESQLKKNCAEMEFAKEKRGHFLYRLFYPKELFSTFVFYLSFEYCIEYFQNIHTFTCQKTLIRTLFCLFLKSLKAFSVSLKGIPIRKVFFEDSF